MLGRRDLNLALYSGAPINLSVGFPFHPSGCHLERKERKLPTWGLGGDEGAVLEQNSKSFDSPKIVKFIRTLHNLIKGKGGEEERMEERCGRGGGTLSYCSSRNLTIVLGRGEERRGEGGGGS